MKHLYTFFLCSTLVLTAMAQDAGDLDLTFSGDGIANTLYTTDLDSPSDVIVQPDGKILVCSEHWSPSGILVMRMLENGMMDEDFGIGGVANIDGLSKALAMTLDSEGRILIAGSYNNMGEVLRINADGTLDEDFGNLGYSFIELTGTQAVLRGLAITDDGSIFACGSSSPDGFTTTDFLLVKLTQDGDPDAFFDEEGIVIIDHAQHDHFNDVVITDDGKIIVSGTTFNFMDAPFFSKLVVAGFNGDGSVNMDYANDGFFEQSAETSTTINMGILPYEDGSVLALGAIENYDGPGELYDIWLVKLTPEGEVDTEWNEDGYSRIDYELDADNTDNLMHDLAMQPDGDIIVTGRAWDTTYGEFGGYRMLTGRINADGTLDTTFGDGGYTMLEFEGWAFSTSLALYDDGRILICGASGTGPGNSPQKITLARYYNETPENISEINHEAMITVSPNPCHDHLMISSQSVISMVQVYSVTGTLAKSIAVNTGAGQRSIMDVSDLPCGAYVLKSGGHSSRFIKVDE